MLPWSGTLSHILAVEPRPRIGYVNQVYFGWVWSGRCIIPAKSVSKISIKLVFHCKVIGINASYQMNHRIGSSWLCLNCLVRQGVGNVSNLCVIKIRKCCQTIWETKGFIVFSSEVLCLPIEQTISLKKHTEIFQKICKDCG